MIPLSNNRMRTGELGEQLAVDFLLTKCAHERWTILARNWRCRSGELDIIAELDEQVVFIEVRTRKQGHAQGTASESVDMRKQLQVRTTAQVYLAAQRMHDRRVRFDVIAVTLFADGTVAELQHYKEAF